MDGRKNNKGTKGNKGGRPTKADEMKVVKLGSDAIIEIYGSIEQYYQFIAKQSKESFPHLKLLQEYVFGKTKDVVEFNDVSENKPDSILNFKDYNGDK